MIFKEELVSNYKLMKLFDDGLVFTVGALTLKGHDFLIKYDMTLFLKE